jgi:sugar lactone lactonase YvrE
MQYRKILAGLLAGSALLSMSMTAFAQEMPPLPEGAEVVAEGLDYPRQLSVGADGTIYVALVGAGGDQMMTTPEGDVPFGASSSVLAIAPDGTQSALVSGIPSAAGIGGATAITWGESSYWVIVSGPGPEAVPATFMASALEFSSEDNHLMTYVDFYGYEVANDPDGNGLDTNSNDALIASDGTIYFLDTGANTLFTWTAEGGLVEFVVWPGNEVPTALAETPDGNIVVSFLGAEIAPGAGKVEVISPAGEVVETYSGYNALTDVAVDGEGNIYAVSLLAGFGEMGPNPGQLLHVNGDGGEVVADGLMLPYGLAIEEDGSFLVSTGSAFLPPASGMILRLPAHAD